MQENSFVKNMLEVKSHSSDIVEMELVLKYFFYFYNITKCSNISWGVVFSELFLFCTLFFIVFYNYIFGYLDTHIKKYKDYKIVLRIKLLFKCECKSSISKLYKFCWSQTFFKFHIIQYYFVYTLSNANFSWNIECASKQPYFIMREDQ